MSTKDVKISEEEQTRRAMRYKRILHDNYTMLSCLKDRYERLQNKSAIKPFIDMLTFWFSFYEDEEIIVKGRIIEFGDFKRDGWAFRYEWHKGETCQVYRSKMTDEEWEKHKQQKAAQKVKRDKQKCIQWGLKYEDIGSTYKHKTIPNVIIRWDGIYDHGRKFPIKFYDFESKTDKIMKLEYFKKNYVKEK